MVRCDVVRPKDDYNAVTVQEAGYEEESCI